MRQKRAKSYRKQMNVYLHTFKFREPYQVIVDAALVLEADKISFDLIKGLNRTIQSEVKPMITQCCMQELYFSKNQRAIDFAKTFERRRCNHPPSSPLPSSECIKSIVDIKGENKHRYVVATQDEVLRRHLRTVPGVPMVFMNRSVMVMEPLSKASTKVQTLVETNKLTHGLNDPKLAGIQEPPTEESDKSQQPQLKKRKGPKQPNPLSVKKKKVATEDIPKEEPLKHRRKRHHGKSSKEDETEVTNSE